MNKASDANSTMRFTYGNVLPYDPADAVHYDFYTTLEGVMQKRLKRMIRIMSFMFLNV